MVPLFASVLKTRGYHFYMTGARISSSLTKTPEVAGFHGWSHLVLILTINAQKYVVDPQFVEVIAPVLLDVDGEDVVFEGVPSTVNRLRYCELSEVIPNRASTSGLQTWVFEYKRARDDEERMASYIFSTGGEWYLEDLEVMSTWLAESAESYFVEQFIIKRVLLAGADEGSVDGN